MHDHNDNNFSPMMWMMAICCLAPIIIAFIVGRSSGGLSAWWILGIVAICLLIHLVMHRKHKHPKIQTTEVENKPEAKDNQP